jgi:hypothetical protein
VIAFDDFEKLLALLREFATSIFFRSELWLISTALEMVSYLVGLLGLVLVKVKLLDVTRRLCERHAGTSHDGQC